MGIFVFLGLKKRLYLYSLCGLFIYEKCNVGFSYMTFVDFPSTFNLLSFYYGRLLNFVKCFFCIIWNRDFSSSWYCVFNCCKCLCVCFQLHIYTYAWAPVDIHVHSGVEVRGQPWGSVLSFESGSLTVLELQIGLAGL